MVLNVGRWLLSACVGFALSSGRAAVEYVDVFTGTSATGHTTPAACRPFGFVQAGPDTGNMDWAYCSGYQFGDAVVRGYSQTHLSGTGCADMGDAQIVPFTGNVPERPFVRAVDKSREKGEPGYYATYQKDDALLVEATATKRVAIYRLTAERGSEIGVVFNPAFCLNAGWRKYKDREATLDLSENGHIRGGAIRSGWVKDRPMRYALTFSRPWTSVRRLSPGKDEQAEACVAMFEAKELLVKIALSQTSVEAAERNMSAELPGWDFDAVRRDARESWESLLSRSSAGGDGRQLRNWYTALYHLYCQPNDWSDVGEEPRFTTLSLWDTFRAAQPWYTLAMPEIIVPEIKSLLRLWKRHGNLPRMSYGGGYVDCMIGDHALPVIADAYLKGFRGFDAREALTAMTNTVTVPHRGRCKEDWETYAKYGYLPWDLVRAESCSRVLEGCYDDWCLSQYAAALGEREASGRFARRSANWRNIFDESIGFVRARDSKGTWRTPFDPYAFSHESVAGTDFTEGNSFQYSWHVMHDVPGLVAAMGGREAFVRRLDSLFVTPEKGPDTADGKRLLDITGLIGQYVHGNEPSHHIIYFYPQLGHPEKAAERIREVFDRFYFPGPDGLSGNDDCGQMSAWYVFSVMGFYPFNPCGGEYVIGAPQVPRVKLRLPNRTIEQSEQSNNFTVIARNLSKENKYVKSVTLNGRRVTDWKIRHAEIVRGGELVFEMSDTPTERQNQQGE